MHYLISNITKKTQIKLRKRVMEVYEKMKLEDMMEPFPTLTPPKKWLCNHCHTLNEEDTLLCPHSKERVCLLCGRVLISHVLVPSKEVPSHGEGWMSLSFSPKDVKLSTHPTCGTSDSYKFLHNQEVFQHIEDIGKVENFSEHVVERTKFLFHLIRKEYSRLHKLKALIWACFSVVLQQEQCSSDPIRYPVITHRNTVHHYAGRNKLTRRGQLIKFLQQEIHRLEQEEKENGGVEKRSG